MKQIVYFIVLFISLIGSPSFAENSATQSQIAHNKILDFASQSVLSTFKLNFLNYKEKLNGIRPLYTKKGYSTLNKYLEETHNLDAIIHKQYVVTSTLRDKAKINNEGVKESFFSKDYVWEVLVPVRLVYQGPDHQIAQEVNVILEIQRVEPSINKDGLAINNLTIHAANEGMPILKAAPN